MSDRSQAEYMREYRKTERGKLNVELQKKRAQAKNRALVILAANHAGEFQRILARELEKLGI